MAAGPSHGPWKKTGPAQRQEHHASVPGGPTEQPRSYRFVWVQNAVRQPQAQSCQLTPARSRPDCELAAEHCQHRTWGSSRISGTLRMGYRGLEQEEPGFSHPEVTLQWWVQVLTWDQELLGSLRTPQLDTHMSSENTTTMRGAGYDSDCFPSLHSLKLG